MGSEIEDFKGHEVMRLFGKETDKKEKDLEIKFGIRKARLILRHMKEIKEFVKSYGG